MRLQAYINDITTEHVGAVVNAAKESLLGGGGVDGYIHDAAGPELLAECQEVLEVEPDIRCMTGDAVLTKAYNMPARFIIHTVGPDYRIYGAEVSPGLLADSYRSSIKLAIRNDCASISFPAISTGAYEFPLQLAALIAVKTSVEFNKEDICVNFVCFDAENLLYYKNAIELIVDDDCFLNRNVNAD